MEKTTISAKGTVTEDKGNHKENPALKHEMDAVRSALSDQVDQATEAYKDVSKIIFAKGMRMNDEMILFESVPVDKKVEFEYVGQVTDTELFEKMFYEHPYKGKVVMVGRQRAKKIRVKPNDIFYYDPSLKHNVFLYNNKKYLVGSTSLIIGVAQYKESLLTKLTRRIKGWMTK